MTQIINLSEHPEVLRIIRAVDPKYRKHKAIIVVTETVSISGTYWDGGSRSSYAAVNMKTLVVGNAPSYNPPQFGGPQAAPRTKIPEGAAIVQVGVFCGKTATATVYISPANAAKLLPNATQGA